MSCSSDDINILTSSSVSACLLNSLWTRISELLNYLHLFFLLRDFCLSFSLQTRATTVTFTAPTRPNVSPMTGGVTVGPTAPMVATSRTAVSSIHPRDPMSMPHSPCLSFSPLFSPPSVLPPFNSHLLFLLPSPLPPFL